MATLALGWMRDLPDPRDKQFTPALAQLPKLPLKVDLRPNAPPPYDQGHLNSCTANAIAGALQINEIKSGNASSWTPSRLFVYYNERVIENTVNSDPGAQIRDGIKVVHKQGVCPEADWPYNTAEYAVKPPANAYSDAAKDLVSLYLRLQQSSLHLRACLAEGYPFVFGISVFSSFESPQVASTGRVPLPPHGDSFVGGHAICAVGYDDTTQQFTFRNSWGAAWGDSGYGYLPYAYVLDSGLASDFWTMRSTPDVQQYPDSSGGKLAAA